MKGGAVGRVLDGGEEPMGENKREFRGRRRGQAIAGMSNSRYWSPRNKVQPNVKRRMGALLGTLKKSIKLRKGRGCPAREVSTERSRAKAKSDACAQLHSDNSIKWAEGRGSKQQGTQEENCLSPRPRRVHGVSRRL